MPLLLLALLLDTSPHVGVLQKTDDGWTFTVEGLKETVLPAAFTPSAPSPAPFKGKRVQVLAESDGRTLTISNIDELMPREKDLVLKITAKASKIAVLEYLSDRGHKHPGSTCRSHAWSRFAAESTTGACAAELRVPAYKNRMHVRVFVRAESKNGAKESDDWSFNGETWLDRALNGVDKPVDVSLEAP
jgi:hypothetical protein